MDTKEMTNTHNDFGYLMKLDRKLCELISVINQMQKDQNRNNARFRHHLHMIQAHMKSQGTNNLVPVDRKKHVRFSKSPLVTADSIEVDGGISGNESIHRECLQDNIDQLTSTMDLKKTFILDELVQEDCLSQDEAEAIRSRHDRKDQNRKLVVTMSRRSSSKFVSFLEIIQRKPNYPEIAKDLRKCYDEKLSEGRRKSQCLICGVKRDVSLKDVVDHLFKLRLVDLEFVDLVASDELYDSSKQIHLWESLFSRIDTSSDRLQALQVFKESLIPKYEHIATKIQLNGELTCQCGQESMEWDFKPNLSYPTSTCSSYDINADSDFSTNAISKQNIDRQISTSNSVVSLEEVKVNDSIPRTLDWLVSTGTSESDDPVTPTKRSNSDSVSSADQNSFADIEKKECYDTQSVISSCGPLHNDLQSLNEIGDSVMIEAAKQESLKQQKPQMDVYIISGNKEERGINADEKQTGNSKKKKKKRRNHKSEPNDLHTKCEKYTSGKSLPELSLETGISRKSAGKCSLPPSNKGTCLEETHTRSIASQFYEELKKIKSEIPKAKEINETTTREHV